MSLSERTVERLKYHAERHCPSEEPDFFPEDLGSHDDAYYVGQDDGKSFLAREVLDDLGIRYKAKTS